MLYSVYTGMEVTRANSSFLWKAVYATSEDAVSWKLRQIFYAQVIDITVDDSSGAGYKGFDTKQG